jgi:capsular polysaccharide biosynthesis protein
MNGVARPTPKFPNGVFLATFFSVFTLVLVVSIVITSRQSKVYISEALLELKFKPTAQRGFAYDANLAKTEAAVLRSDTILKMVIADRNLNAVWGQKYLHGETLKTWETLNLLQRRTDIHPVPGTAIILVREFDDDPNEAAAIANSFSKSYVGYVASHDKSLSAQIMDNAYPDEIPIRPGKFLNYLKGTFAGITLGLATALIISLVIKRKNQKFL